MQPKPFNVLFLCTGNSARSIIAECVLNRIGAGAFQAYSAGSTPSGRVNPNALALLQGQGYETTGLRSKSWDEFAQPGAPEFDFIITVCDNAAGEVCPIWPGKPTQAHWGLPDPAAVAGSPAEISFAFADAYRALTDRITAFVNLPIASLDPTALKRRLSDIGSTSAAPEAL